MTRTARGGVLLAFLTLIGAAYLWVVLTGPSSDVRTQGDALVYRAGTLAWLDGTPVYTERLDLELGAGQMFFTYGPLSLLLFVPLALLPLEASFVALAVVSLLMIAAAMGLWARALGLPRGDAAVVGLAIAVASGVTQPLLDHLQIGQVNALLLLLATLDLLPRRTPWPRGLLVGLAIAVKITPAALLLLPLLRRDWRTILIAGSTAAAAVAASWLIVPREASYFWFTAFRDPDRVGNLRSAQNQSMRAIAERWIDGPLGGLLWLAAATVVVMGVSILVLGVLIPRDDVVGAAAVVFVLPALLSPVAWTHHWVWSLPLLAWLAARALRGSRAAALTTAIGIGVLALYPLGSFDPLALIPQTEEWSPVAAALAGGYVYWALGALAVVPTVIGSSWSRALRAARLGHEGQGRTATSRVRSPR